MNDLIASNDAGPRSNPLVDNLLLRLAVPIVMFAVLYGAVYGVARWRKYIVMRDYGNKEQGLTVRHTQPGYDLRGGWRGQARNDAMFVVFRPLCALEDLLRGGNTTHR